MYVFRVSLRCLSQCIYLVISFVISVVRSFFLPLVMYAVISVFIYIVRSLFLSVFL